jgi:hypothetical protein
MFDITIMEWNNVANMHELLTVHAQTKSKQYSACQDCPLVQCACAGES